MKKYSISIFGSSLRPNFDKYSDKDLLMVSDSYSTLAELKKKYESEGYSVSTYTYKKLKYLSEKGSLFVQHLKVESKILIDYKDLLKSILDNHKETQPSNEQIYDSIEYFNFLRIIPDSVIGYAWFCDCFYVGIRNYLILKSASERNYNFSFLSLLSDLLITKDIDSNDYEALRQLRVLKKSYREKIYNEFPSKDFINSLINIGRKLNLLSFLNFETPDNYKTYLLNLVRANKTNYYFKLRLIEIYYLLSGQRLEELDKIICNPQLYAIKFKDVKFIDRIVTDIEKKNGTQQSFVEMGNEVVKSSEMLLSKFVLG